MSAPREDPDFAIPLPEKMHTWATFPDTPLPQRKWGFEEQFEEQFEGNMQANAPNWEPLEPSNSDRQSGEIEDNVGRAGDDDNADYTNESFDQDSFEASLPESNTDNAHEGDPDVDQGAAEIQASAGATLRNESEANRPGETEGDVTAGLDQPFGVHLEICGRRQPEDPDQGFCSVLTIAVDRQLVFSFYLLHMLQNADETTVDEVCFAFLRDLVSVSRLTSIVIRFPSCYEG